MEGCEGEREGERERERERVVGGGERWIFVSLRNLKDIMEAITVPLGTYIK